MSEKGFSETDFCPALLVPFESVMGELLHAMAAQEHVGRDWWHPDDLLRGLRPFALVCDCPGGADAPYCPSGGKAVQLQASRALGACGTVQGCFAAGGGLFPSCCVPVEGAGAELCCLPCALHCTALTAALNSAEPSSVLHGEPLCYS